MPRRSQHVLRSAEIVGSKIHRMIPAVIAAGLPGNLRGRLDLCGDGKKIAPRLDQNRAHFAPCTSDYVAGLDVCCRDHVAAHLRKAAPLRSPRAALHAIIVNQRPKCGPFAMGAFVVI
jgi:hypothetical protein